MEKFDYKKIIPKIQKVKLENPEVLRVDLKETNDLLKKISEKKDDEVNIVVNLKIV
jgi:hypothetical protein